MRQLSYIDRDDYNMVMHDDIGNKWKYISHKDAVKNGMRDDMEIIGDIDLKQKGGAVAELFRDRDRLKVRNHTKRNRFSFKILGYMGCRDEDSGQEGLVMIVEERMIRNLILTALLLAILITGCIYWMNKDHGPAIDDAAVAYKMPDGAVNEDGSTIAIPGYSDLVMEAGSDELYAALVNPEGNECYFRYRIVLEDSDQIIYESEFIKPGTAITNVKLNQKMPKGVYDVKLIVTPYALNDYKSQLNGGVVETKLVAK